MINNLLLATSSGVMLGIALWNFKKSETNTNMGMGLSCTLGSVTALGFIDPKFAVGYTFSTILGSSIATYAFGRKFVTKKKYGYDID
jgi:hypothetical protein